MGNEGDLEQGGVATWESLWSTAVMDGISVFVAAGDSGAAGTTSGTGQNPGYCDVHGSPAPAMQSVNTNGFGTSSSDTCVGGTEFNDTASPATYWASSNTPTTYGSALSYIPEGSWNDPMQMNNGTTTYVVLAGGGGVAGPGDVVLLPKGILNLAQSGPRGSYGGNDHSRGFGDFLSKTR